MHKATCHISKAKLSHSNSMMTGRPENASTVYLTPQEIHRIRSTVSSTIQLASKLTGSPRQPRDSASSIREATAASLMVDMAGSSQGQDLYETVPILTVGRAYPPCTIPTSDLQPMRLSKLRMETHHRGYKLMLKRAPGVRGQGVSAVVQLKLRSWVLVQDLEGNGDDLERLEICLHTHKHGKEMLECSAGTVLVVREPYFTVSEQGVMAVRVDHPSDLEFLDSEEEALGHMSGCSCQCEDADTAARKARHCKEKGNAALARRDPASACAHYTLGLSQHEPDQHQTRAKCHPNNTHLDAIVRDLYRNRAHTHLLLNRLDAAKRDALSSLIESSATDIESRALNSKSYYRAGCAAYNLRDYGEAKAMFSRRLELTPEVGDATTKKVEQRVLERDIGAYELPQMRAVAALPRSREMDAASFLGRTQVGGSQGRGRGLFAACDVPCGGLVLCEKAFCVAWGDAVASPATAITYDVRDSRIRLSPISLVRAVVEKLRGTPSYMDQVLDLYDGYRQDDGAHRPKVDTDDRIPVVDVFHVHDIVSRNAFGLDPSTRISKKPGVDTGGAAISTGLWTHAARINHSCLPNIEKEFIGDMMVIRAKRPIAAGDELLHSYVDETSSYRARQEALATTWGFECNCGRCERQGGR